MKKLLLVIVIIMVAAFIYYTKQNIFAKNSVRREWENQIENYTGLDVDLKDTLRNLERLEDDVLQDSHFQDALNGLNTQARDRLKRLSPQELDQLMNQLEEGAEDYKEILDEHLGNP
ncbi:MAG: hypothetical protein PF447_03345 [Spirochaetaceae bacterium]|jgi:peptidoglycan hydrolase CwlO-like protein|nr:hypothetical protein [Spirochaetaceae bacterium]